MNESAVASHQITKPIVFDIANEDKMAINDQTNGQQGVIVAQPSSANQQQMVPLISGIGEELRELIDEMRLQDYDSIRFATYRAASKLRFIQTKTNAHQIDIWNMVILVKLGGIIFNFFNFSIESFRENGLNAMNSLGQLKISRLELLLTSVYHNLNKRLPANQQVDTDKNIATLLHFLLSAYDRQRRLTVFAIKIALATMCSGKLVDKLRYIFSQISEPSGSLLDHEKFAEYLQQVLALPTAVFEGPTFGYSQLALSQCFQRHPPEQVTLNKFLDTILGENCPACLIWLPLLHRMASVENVYHPVVCDSCQVRSFTGFRYKCQRCTNYQLCQSCFWRGRVSQSHTNEHEMKEYNSYKSPTKQLAHTIQKSLQCVPSTHQRTHKDFPSRPQRALDLNFVVPTPIPSFKRQLQEQKMVVDAEWTAQFLPGQFGNPAAMDDEHKLIARYAAKLDGRTVYSTDNRRLPFSLPIVASSIGEKQMLGERVLIARLEEENQEILREMQSLEEQQVIYDNTGQLNTLREQTMELEARMREKQQRRRELMIKLESVMTNLNNSSMPTIFTSTAGENSRRGRSTTSGGIPLGQLTLATNFGQPRTAVVSLQGDLLQAADEITQNMSQLVRELEKKDATTHSDEPETPHVISNFEQRKKETNTKTRSNSANETLTKT